MATNHTITSSKLAERGHALLESGLYSDLLLEVDHENVKHSFKVHRIALIFASSVWASAVKWADEGVLKITEYSFPTIQAVVYFAYTGTVTFQDLAQCIDILAAAHYYDMKSLQNKCSEYIQTLFLCGEMNLKNLIDVFNKATLYDVESVKMNCLAYIEDNTKQVFESKEFLDISVDSLLLILSSERYLCSECYLIRSTLRWAEHVLSNTNCEDMKDFLVKTNISSHFRFKRLKAVEVEELYNDYPTLFAGEIKCPLLLGVPTSSGFNSDASLMSSENQILETRVVVRCPPMIICEEFIYNGPAVAFPIYSLEIEPRYNTVNAQFSGRYEEKFSVTIDNHTGHFEGVVNKREGVTIHFTDPINLALTQGSVIKIYIQLDKCGFYWKNSNFSELFRNGLVRFKSGLIMSINNFEKSSSSSEGNEAEDPGGMF